MSAPSYVHGASSVTLLGETIGENLRRTVERHGDREALVARHQAYRTTYRELWEQTGLAARGLMSRGVKKGDRVGIWATNRQEWVVAQYATARMGAILVNINPAYRTSELEYALNQSGTSFLILARAFRTADYVAMLAEVKGRCPELREALVLEDGWNALLRDGERVSEDDLAQREAELQFDEPINIQYTSGTTGFPKGATLSHHGILNNAFFIGQRLAYTEQDRVCIPVPLDLRRAHDVHRRAGPPRFFAVRLLQPADRGHGRLAMPGRGHEEGADGHEHERGDHLLRHDRDLAGLNPKQHRRPPREARLDCGTRASARRDQGRRPRHRTRGAARTARRALQSRLHCHAWLLEQPGSDSRGDRRRPLDAHRRPRDDGRGRLLEHRRPDQGHDHSRWREHLSARGGEFLYSHPDVADVQVFGVPSERYGEEVMAWVRFREGVTLTGEDLASYCRGRIATYKIPRYWKFVDEFPMTVTGKIQKFKMREAAVDELGLQQAASIRTA